jgi:hypothetical protein
VNIFSVRKFGIAVSDDQEAGCVLRQ